MSMSTKKRGGCRICGLYPRQSRTVTEVIVEPTPKRQRPVCLKSAAHVLHEMQRVYRACRAGELLTQEGSRLIFMLAQIRATHEVVVLERRIAALEAPRAETSN